MRRRCEEFRNAGAQIVTISADVAKDLVRYCGNNEVPFLMLSDSDRKVIKEYGVYNPREHGGVAIPAIFLIDKSGVVRYEHVERTMIRVRNKTLLEEARKL